MPQFPEEKPEEKVTPSNIRLQKNLWDRLDRIAALEKRSRNDVVDFFLRWACDDYDSGKGVDTNLPIVKGAARKTR